MNENVGFQYSILHYRHDITTGEILNIGLALFSPQSKFFKGETTSVFRRILEAFPNIDANFLRKYTDKINSKMEKMERDFKNNQLSISSYDTHALNKLLPQIITPDDSSIFFGEIKYGLAKEDELENIFDQLYYSIIDKYNFSKEKNSRSNQDVWKFYKKPLQKLSVSSHLKPQLIQTENDEIRFDFGWKNGKINILEPISFDLTETTNMRKKSREMIGTLFNINQTNKVNNLYLLLGEPKNKNGKHKKVYDQSKDQLNDFSKSKDINFNIIMVEENEAEDFAIEIKSKLKEDLNLPD